jgi:catechol 2,3-dioxygenase-like lactoylglutathione lyase family enzyme
MPSRRRPGKDSPLRPPRGKLIAGQDLNRGARHGGDRCGRGVCQKRRSGGDARLVSGRAGHEPQYGEFDFRHRRSADRFEDGARTIFARFDAASTYFDPSPHPIMINLMVDDLDAILARLADRGVPLVAEPETYPYGRFAWIMDPDGVKLELWESVRA